MLGLGEAGYREVTLLGQNIDAYGRDLPGMAADASGRRAWTFTDLLHHIHDVSGIERIRFATSHPRWSPQTWVCLPHHDIWKDYQSTGKVVLGSMVLINEHVHMRAQGTTQPHPFGGFCGLLTGQYLK